MNNLRIIALTMAVTGVLVVIVMFRIMDIRIPATPPAEPATVPPGFWETLDNVRNITTENGNDVPR